MPKPFITAGDLLALSAKLSLADTPYIEGSTHTNQPLLVLICDARDALAHAAREIDRLNKTPAKRDQGIWFKSLNDQGWWQDEHGERRFTAELAARLHWALESMEDGTIYEILPYAPPKKPE